MTYDLPPHRFHIPVMGIAFTIDTPIKVASYGITSAISIIEDNLIEMMRKHYYQENDEPYVPIEKHEENYRVRRITGYLNLVNHNVQTKFEKLKESAFEKGSEIMKYFEMLPGESALKEKYRQFLQAHGEAREELESFLRKHMRPGNIEVNIMTKVDKNNLDSKGEILPEGSDALGALKAYAKSDLENSAVIFSAGMNPRLFNYLEKFREFDASAWGVFKKKVIIKVSDYRSALIQGKYLAKKGIWVSEFRIESGLNCGGHAFATQGYLLGPNLEEFRIKKEELAQELFSLYNPAIQARGEAGFEKPHPVNITVQGGIGTAAEQQLLYGYYGVNGTGWGTPFLLCPEATTVDDNTLELLSKSKENDVVLSKASPLGVRFNYLKNTTADKERQQRIAKGKPGSPCTEKYLVSNTEFTKEPICTASRKYQKLKLEQLKNAGLPEKEYQLQVEDLLSKECLCIGLSNSAGLNYNVPIVEKLDAVTICPGPNIANFSKIASLQEMTDHIYGRRELPQSSSRPHMFLKELQLYVDYLKEEMRNTFNSGPRDIKGWNSFCNNLLNGVAHYRKLVGQELIKKKEAFEEGLDKMERAVIDIKSSLTEK
ncbi:nitronate monooxygenase family protein [Salinimicrobium sp. CAU 1759]